MLTGLWGAWGGVGGAGTAVSRLGACLLMSSVVKRLDNNPRMCMMDGLLDGQGCTEREIERESLSTAVFIVMFNKTKPFSYADK